MATSSFMQAEYVWELEQSILDSDDEGMAQPNQHQFAVIKSWHGGVDAPYWDTDDAMHYGLGLGPS